MIGAFVSRLVEKYCQVQDDNKALDSYTKWKEDALLEAKRIVQVASSNAYSVWSAEQEPGAGEANRNLPGMVFLV